MGLPPIGPGACHSSSAPHRRVTGRTGGSRGRARAAAGLHVRAGGSARRVGGTSGSGCTRGTGTSRGCPLRPPGCNGRVPSRARDLNTVRCLGPRAPAESFPGKGVTDRRAARCRRRAQPRENRGHRPVPLPTSNPPRTGVWPRGDLDY